MKTLLALGLTLVPALAYADAPDLTDQPSSSTVSTTTGRFYVAGLYAPMTSERLGGDSIAAEAGYRIGDSPLWVHGKYVSGVVNNGLFGNLGITLWQARAGAEGRACLLDGALCGIAGLDLGLQHSATHKYEGVPLVDQHLAMTTVTDRPIAVPRIAIDAKITHGLRVRPGAELVVDNHGYNGVAAGAGLAYQW